MHRAVHALLAPLWLFSAAAAELTDLRNWTGTNGKVIRATYAGTQDKGAKVVLVDTQGKFLVVSVSNLIESDRELIEQKGQPASEEDKPKAGSSSAFKTFPQLDRDKLPIISQGDFGSKASDCVPSSFCNFLLWWDQEGVLEIPKRGDFDKKAEWIHSRMARYCGTRNTAGTSARDATEGFTKYFTKEIGDLATLRIHIDYNLKPENLARYTVGEAATMLEVTIRSGPQHDSSHWVALSEAKPDGSVVFHTWGARFKGKLEVMEANEETTSISGQTVPKTTYEIKIQNHDDLPEWFRDSGRRFILDPMNWDSIYVLKPYVFATPGKRADPPVDPLFE
jgi:hypothetical protein